jgi:hypothetical protein
VKQGAVLSAWPKANEPDTGTSVGGLVPQDGPNSRVKRRNIVITLGKGKAQTDWSCGIDAKKLRRTERARRQVFEFRFGGIKPKPNPMLNFGQSTKRQPPVSQRNQVRVGPQ